MERRRAAVVGGIVGLWLGSVACTEQSAPRPGASSSAPQAAPGTASAAAAWSAQGRAEVVNAAPVSRQAKPLGSASTRELATLTEQIVTQLPADRGVLVIPRRQQLNGRELSLESEAFVVETTDGSPVTELAAAGDGVAVELDAGSYSVRPKRQWQALADGQGALTLPPSRLVQVSPREVSWLELTAEPGAKANGACGAELTTLAKRRAGAAATCDDGSGTGYLAAWNLARRRCNGAEGQELLSLETLEPGFVVEGCAPLTKPAAASKRGLFGACREALSRLGPAWGPIDAARSTCDDAVLWTYYERFMGLIARTRATCELDELATGNWREKLEEYSAKLLSVRDGCPSPCAKLTHAIEAQRTQLAPYLASCTSGAVWDHVRALEGLSGEAAAVCPKDPAAQSTWAELLAAAATDLQNVQAACADPSSVAARCPMRTVHISVEKRALFWVKTIEAEVVEYVCTDVMDIALCAQYLNEGSVERWTATITKGFTSKDIAIDMSVCTLPEATP